MVGLGNRFDYPRKLILSLRGEKLLFQQLLPLEAKEREGQLHRGTVANSLQPFSRLSQVLLCASWWLVNILHKLFGAARLAQNRDDLIQRGPIEFF